MTTTEHMVAGYTHLFAGDLIDKWTYYATVFHQMDRGRITLTRICELADPIIPPAVMRMRRRDYLNGAL